MSSPLIVCSSCARHVRSAEDACPFCRAAIAIGAPRPAPSLPRSRAALLGIAALASVGASGCYRSHERPADGSVVDASEVDAGTDAGGSVALYGGPSALDVIV